MKSNSLTFTLVSLLIALALVGAGVYGAHYYIHDVPSVDTDTTVEINKGDGLKVIALKLREKGVIVNEHLFILYVMYEGLQDKLKAGEYEFATGSTMYEVLQKLSKGDVLAYKVTIPEGLTVYEVGELLESNNIVTKEEFMTLSGDSELQAELLPQGSNGFEGYLFPETYTFNKGVTALELITMMVNRFNTVYGSLESERAGSGLSDIEIITLASIIEKETGVSDERGLVSAVFHNRLRLGMKLDSDPTVIYGLDDDYKGALRKSDLKRLTDYNTYIIKGLPPGPIANPGKQSIEAALNPAQVNYLYFVSKGDGSGTHTFSSNYNDHRRAVYEYRKRIKE